MGWMDKLKDWAVDKIEDEFGGGDDNGGGGQDAGAADGGGGGFFDRAIDFVSDKLGDEFGSGGDGDGDGKTGADGGEGGGGFFDRAVDFVSDKIEGTWAGDLVDGAKDLLGGDAVAEASAPLSATASTMTAADLGQAAGSTIANNGGDALPWGATVKPAAPADMSMTIPATPETGQLQNLGPAPMEPAPMEPAATSGPAMEDPVVVEPAPEPTQFESSMAAADQVESSVDDMFADLG